MCEWRFLPGKNRHSHISACTLILSIRKHKDRDDISNALLLHLRQIFWGLTARAVGCFHAVSLLLESDYSIAEIRNNRTIITRNPPRVATIPCGGRGGMPIRWSLRGKGSPQGRRNPPEKHGIAGA